jgi:hypothetical protein
LLALWKFLWKAEQIALAILSMKYARKQAKPATEL